MNPTLPRQADFLAGSHFIEALTPAHHFVRIGSQVAVVSGKRIPGRTEIHWQRSDRQLEVRLPRQFGEACSRLRHLASMDRSLRKRALEKGLELWSTENGAVGSLPQQVGEAGRKHHLVAYALLVIDQK